MMTFGPDRYFIPICIRHPHGFYGGPAGYEESDDPNAKTIIVEERPMTIETTLWSPPEPPLAIAGRIQYHRQAVGLSREELANRLQVDEGLIEWLECGKVHPTAEMLEKLADALRVTISEFKGGKPCE